MIESKRMSPLNEAFFNKLGYFKDNNDRYSQQLIPVLKVSFKVYPEEDPQLGTEVEAFVNDERAYTGYWHDIKDFVTQFRRVLPPIAAEHIQQ